MKLLYSNIKKGEVKVRIENPDDLWYLSNIIDTGDLVKGRTLRKIKIGNTSAVRKPVFLKIRVEKIELSSTLRLTGVITEANEEIQLGSYHSFNLEENSIITIIKEKWLKFQLDKLKEACFHTTPILICVFDREEAYFALMKKYGYDIISHIQGEVEKKHNAVAKGNFYSSIAAQLKEYEKRYGLRQIILASPAFWKEYLMKEMSDELKNKIVLATCSSVGRNGINEVMKRPEVMQALKNERTAIEINLVEELLVEIGKNNLAAYGIKDVENAALAGAVRQLLITDFLIKSSREEGFYNTIESIMKNVDNTKGDVVIISSEHEGGKKLNGLGGIGALLRYKIYQ